MGEESCYWDADYPGSDMFSTSCKHAFRLDDGGPEENEMKFCCFCGRPLVEEPATIEE